VTVLKITTHGSSPVSCPLCGPTLPASDCRRERGYTLCNCRRCVLDFKGPARRDVSWADAAKFEIDGAGADGLGEAVKPLWPAGKLAGMTGSMPRYSPTIRRWVLNSLFVAVTGATWGVLWLATRHSKGLGNRRSFMAPLVLIGVTVAVHRLIRAKSDSWLRSAALAGVITLVVMAGIASIQPISDYIEFG